MNKRTAEQIHRLAIELKKSFDKYPELWFANYAQIEVNVFDYPKYGNLPVRMSYRLTPDCVDAIQTLDRTQLSTVADIESVLRDYKIHGYGMPYDSSR